MDRDDEHIKRSVKVMKKSGKLWFALAGVVMGVLLLLFGGGMDDLFGQKNHDASGTPSSEGEERLSMEEYRLALEARICRICARVEGS